MERALIEPSLDRLCRLRRRAIAIVSCGKYGGAPLDWMWVALTAAFALVGAGAGVFLLFKRDDKGEGAVDACAGGLLAHAALAAGLAPRMTPLWITRSLAQAVAEHHVDPRNGVTEGPIAVLGYAEPSLVFCWARETQLIAPVDMNGNPDAMVRAVGRGGFEERAAFLAQLAKQNLSAVAVATVTGVNCSRASR